MIVELKDLKIGDEIIIGAGSHLKYLKLERTPQLNGKLGYYTKNPLYKTVRCSCNMEQEVFSSYGGRTRTKNKVICTPEGHNTSIYQDLNYKTIWLVKRQ